MSLVSLILEYGFACWDPCREGQINASDRVQRKATQFKNHTKNSEWETFVRHITIARLCALFKATLRDGPGKLHATGCEGFAI